MTAGEYTPDDVSVAPKRAPAADVAKKSTIIVKKTTGKIEVLRSRGGVMSGDQCRPTLLIKLISDASRDTETVNRALFFQDRCPRK